MKLLYDTGKGNSTAIFREKAPMEARNEQAPLALRREPKTEEPGIRLKSGLLNLLKKKKRKESRENRALPVKVVGDNVKGVTRDLSASGVCFEIDGHYHVGSSIKMTIEFGDPQGMQLECEGTIVRVEKHGSDKVGVAVRMNPLRSRLMHSPEDRANRSFGALGSREPAVKANKRLSVGVVRCANPQSPKYGQHVGKCEFRSLPACDHAERDPDKEFGCKFALLKVPA